MGLRVHYSTNFTIQSSGTNEVQETIPNSTEEKKMHLYYIWREIIQITTIHWEGGFSEAVTPKVT